MAEGNKEKNTVMSLSAYLWGIRLFTLLSLCAWLGIVFGVDPVKDPETGALLFFISFFALLLGVLTLVMTRIYCMSLGEDAVGHSLGDAFRQAFLLSLYGESLLYFQYERILTWWDGLLLLATAFLLEYSFRIFFRQHPAE